MQAINKFSPYSQLQQFLLAFWILHRAIIKLEPKKQITVSRCYDFEQEETSNNIPISLLYLTQYDTYHLLNDDAVGAEAQKEIEMKEEKEKIFYKHLVQIAYQATSSLYSSAQRLQLQSAEYFYCASSCTCFIFPSLCRCLLLVHHTSQCNSLAFFAVFYLSPCTFVLFTLPACTPQACVGISFPSTSFLFLPFCPV